MCVSGALGRGLQEVKFTLAQEGSIDEVLLDEVLCIERLLERWVYLRTIEQIFFSIRENPQLFGVRLLPLFVSLGIKALRTSQVLFLFLSLIQKYLIMLIDLLNEVSFILV